MNNRRICILADIRYTISLGGSLQVYKIEAKDGLPGADWEPLYTEDREDDTEFQFWRCNNCGRQCNNYQEIRDHLGKFHELLDPFTLEEKKKPPG